MKNKGVYSPDYFDYIAEQYDCIISTLSLSLHTRWKQKCIETACVLPEHKVLDIATGTGDIALALSRLPKPPRAIFGCDHSHGMLRHAQKHNPHIHWLQCQAEQLPFAENSMHRIFISFALRFMQHEKVLKECYRILKPEGRLIILDTSPWEKRYHPWISLFDRTIGRAVSLYYLKNARAYESMYQSIQNNINHDRILFFLSSAGFQEIEHRTEGFGIVTRYQARKTSSSQVARQR